MKSHFDDATLVFLQGAICKRPSQRLQSQSQPVQSSATFTILVLTWIKLLHLVTAATIIHPHHLAPLASSWLFLWQTIHLFNFPLEQEREIDKEDWNQCGVWGGKWMCNNTISLVDVCLSVFYHCTGVSNWYHLPPLVPPPNSPNSPKSSCGKSTNVTYS